MTRREIVYLILDEIKSINSDSYIVEEHVLFLMNIYRGFLIELKKKLDKLNELSNSYNLEICISLLLLDAIPGVSCSGQYLKSTQLIPSLIDNSVASIYPTDLFNDIITYIPRERFPNVGYNKYMTNIIYATLGKDNYLYLKSNNPLHKYLSKVILSGVFEDSDKAELLSCENQEEGLECIDILDKEFPIASELVPQMILFITKELYQALIRPSDSVNNDMDDIASIMSYIARNMKNNYLKALEL